MSADVRYSHLVNRSAECKRKNDFMEWCKLCGKDRNDSYYLRIDQLSSGKSKVTM